MSRFISVQKMAIYMTTIVCIIAPNLVWAVLQGPTTSGGGGNICYLNTGPELLDLVRPERPAVARIRQAGVQIPVVAGRITPFYLDRTALEAKLKELMQPLQKRYPGLSKILSFGIVGRPYLSIDETFSEPYKFYLHDPSVCKEKNVRAIIGLTEGLKFVSAPKWNELDLETQAHLIVHEGWRYIQDGTDFKIDDKTLQDLTYGTIFSVDSLNHIQGLTSAYLQWIGMAPDFQARGCQMLREKHLDSLDFKKIPPTTLLALQTVCEKPLEFTRVTVQTSLDALTAFANKNPRMKASVQTLVDVYNRSLQNFAIADANRDQALIGRYTRDILVIGDLLRHAEAAQYGIRTHNYNNFQYEDGLAKLLKVFPLNWK